MKKISFSLLLISIATMLSIISCGDKEHVIDLITASDVKIASNQALDADNVTSNIDDALDKVNTDLANYNASAREEINIDGSTCGYTVDSQNFIVTISGTSQNTLVYNFDGSFCDGRTRTGKITATLITGNYFKDENAQYQLLFEGYAVTKNGETVTLSGTQLVTNVTGGSPRFVITNSNTFSNVIHHVTGDMTLTFDSGETRTWNIDRKMTWTKLDIDNVSYLNISVNSERSYNGKSNVSVYGTNRAGYEFYTQIISPITMNGKCGWYKPSGGERKHTILDTDGSIKLTTETHINVGSDGCAVGFTVTATNRRGKLKTFTVTY